MIGDIVIDKDGILAGAVFTEMAIYLKSNNMTCVQKYSELQQRYGYFVTNNKYLFCYDPTKLEKIFNDLRNKGKYIERCGRFDIVGVRDLTTGYDSTRADKKAILPISASTYMITFYFKNEAVATIRGSGTEPKLKYYVELRGKEYNSTKKELDELVASLIEECLKPSYYGLELPKD